MTHRPPGLDETQTEYVVRRSVAILRDPNRDRLLTLLRRRLRDDDYPPDADEERDLDRVVLAVTTALDETLRGGGPDHG